MGTLTPAACRKQIASSSLDPVYLVLGEDDHAKDEVANDFEEIVDEDLRAFNIDRFHGADASFNVVLDAVRTLPVMVPRRIVIILRAERLLQPKRESQTAMLGVEAFEKYLDAPLSHATLVLVADGLDERRRISKRLLSCATVVKCGELEDLADAERWIRARLKANSRRAEPQVIRLLGGLVGPDIARLRSEVDRILLYTAGQETISMEDVREVAGAARVHDDWAVARAIERGATEVALRELALALDAGAVPYMVLGQLAWVARTRLSAGRVRSAIEAVFRTDLDLKRSSGEPRVLLERLVLELCGVAAVRPLR